MTTTRLRGEPYERQHDRCMDADYIVNGRHVRTRVRRNFYDFQSEAYAELFDGNQWHRVASIPCAEMASVIVGSRYAKTYRTWLQEDEDALIERVKELLASA